MQRLVLTSSGITNDTIRRSAERLLGKPISEASAVFVPTAVYGMPGGGDFAVWGISGELNRGWGSLSLLELTAAAHLPHDYWRPALETADVLIVTGGNTFYLSHWLRQSGLSDLLPGLLRDKLYVGVSAGSMVMTHHLHVDQDLANGGTFYDDEYDEAAPPGAGAAWSLAQVDFVIRPHLNNPHFPNITLDRLKEYARRSPVPMYAIDDQTAIIVDGDRVEVVSEGLWHRFDPPSDLHE